MASGRVPAGGGKCGAYSPPGDAAAGPGRKCAATAASCAGRRSHRPPRWRTGSRVAGAPGRSATLRHVLAAHCRDLKPRSADSDPPGPRARRWRRGCGGSCGSPPRCSGTPSSRHSGRQRARPFHPSKSSGRRRRASVAPTSASKQGTARRNAASSAPSLTASPNSCSIRRVSRW